MMASEFQCHPTDIVEPSELRTRLDDVNIPRLTYTEMKGLAKEQQKPAFPQLHYTGPKKLS